MMRKGAAQALPYNLWVGSVSLLIMSTGLISISAQAGPDPRSGPAVTAEAAKEFRRAYRYALKELGLGPKSARRFARSLIKHARTSDALERYAWAYSQFDLMYPEGRAAALKLAEHVSWMDPIIYGKYSPAFEFAFGEGDMDLDYDIADAFATKAAQMPDEYLENYRAAYRAMIRAGIIDEIGRQLELRRELARMIADSAARAQAEALPRYRWVFGNYPAARGKDFVRALDLAESLSAADQDTYDQFRNTVSSEMKREHSTFRRAADSAESRILPPGLTDVLERRLGEQISQGRGKPGTSAGDFSAQVPCTAAGLSIGEIGGLIPSFGQDLKAIQAINQKWSAKYDSRTPALIQQSIRLASEAFSLPEKFIACSYKTESSFSPTARSPAGARGIAQITDKAYEDISQIIHSGGPLEARWDTYTREQSLLGNEVPSSRSSSDFKKLTKDAVWSIGAGALFSRNYEQQFFGDIDVNQLTIEDLAMIAGAYNMGVGGLKQYCNPGQYASCLQNIERASQKYPGYMETVNHMEKIRSCLAAD